MSEDIEYYVKADVKQLTCNLNKFRFTNNNPNGEDKTLCRLPYGKGGYTYKEAKSFLESLSLKLSEHDYESEPPVYYRGMKNWKH